MVSAFISSATAPMARLTPEDTMPCTQSTLSWSTSFLRRSIESFGLVSSSTISSTLRPAMPPPALMRATAYSVPRRPHSPMVPAMPALGAMMPTRSGFAWARAGKLRYGVAAATAPPAPRAFSSFLRLPFMELLLGFVLLGDVGADRVAGELLDGVEQPVARFGGAVLVAVGDGAGDVGVQLCRMRHVGRLLVVDVPEAARQRVHEAHGAGGELVVGGGRAERVEL